MQSKKSLDSNLAVIFDCHVCFPCWLKYSAVVYMAYERIMGNKQAWRMSERAKKSSIVPQISIDALESVVLFDLVSKKVFCWRKELDFKISSASVELGISSALEQEPETSVWEFRRM